MFARAYDILMSDVDYGAVYQWISSYLKPDDFIIDAGCGTGYLLLELIQRGHDAIGIDIDPSMLAIATEKFRSEHLSVALYEHDLRTPMAAKADVILAMFDVMNYMKGVKEVMRHFKQALNPGGRLIFDVYKIEVLSDYDGYEEEDDEPFHYVWKIDTYGHMMRHRVTIGDETDVIRQYVYPIDYYLDILKSLGFHYEISEGLDPRKHMVVAYL